MTARRAVQELADKGVLKRTQGSGTYVADLPKSSPYCIKDVVAAAKAENSHLHKIFRLMQFRQVRNRQINGFAYRYLGISVNLVASSR